jgi:TPP-dependent pyruvate/acetoin dehydrogenase alpha subunit
MGKLGIGKSLWNLPFVHVYERNDFSVSFFAFQIYPETIRKSLSDKCLAGKVTGKFTMEVMHNKNKDQYLEINVEMRPKQKSGTSLIKKIQQCTVKHLLRDNSEYRKTAEEYPNKTIPKSRPNINKNLKSNP